MKCLNINILLPGKVNLEVLKTIMYLKIQTAFNNLPWSEEDVHNYALDRFEAEGLSKKDADRLLYDKTLGEWIIKEGINQAISKTKPKFGPQTPYTSFQYTIPPEPRPRMDYLLYFRMPLPDGDRFTMLPVLFDRRTFLEEYYDFFQEKFDGRKCILGDEDKWNGQWKGYWETAGIGQTDWIHHHHAYWQALFNAKKPNKATTDFFDQTAGFAKGLIESNYQAWIQAAKS